MISGSQSLGSTPAFTVDARWRIGRLWDIGRVRSEKNTGDLQLLSVFLGRGVIPYGHGGGQVHKPSLNLADYQVVHPGDLVLNNQQAWRGSVGVSDYHGIISPAYVVLDLDRGLDPRFADYLFKSQIMVSQFVTASKGVGDIQRDIYFPWLKNVRLPLPPLEQQVAIGRFLDYVSQRILLYIRAKNRLAALLDELRKTVIHRAVTRGTDPSVPLRPSGNPWLGDIPQHWGVSRSKNLFTVRKELARAGDVQLSATQAYGVVPQAEFERRVGRRVVKIAMHLDRRKHVEQGDFVISMRSFQGGLERAWAPGAIRSSYVVLKPQPSVDVDFFSHLLKSAGYVGALQATADFIRDGQDLTFDNFRRVALPLIPLEEQATIGRFIVAATSRIDVGVARLRSEVELLHEYRVRLVSDVVAGHLDVQEAAVSLPDQTSGQPEEDYEDPLDGMAEQYADLDAEVVEA